MTIGNKNSLYSIYFMVLAVIFLGFEFFRSGDFYIYLEASADLFSSENIFHKKYGTPPTFFYFGNPFLTSILRPFTLLPFHISAFIWKILNIFLLFKIFQFIEELLFQSHLKSAIRSKATLLLMLGSFFLVYSNLHLVQLTIVILFLCFESLNQTFYKKKPLLGGLLLGLAMCFKLTPIVFLPYLLYKQQWRSFNSALVVLFTAILIPSIYVGWELNLTLWQNWFSALTPENPDWATFDMNNRKNHGISAWLSTLFIANIEDNVVRFTHRRHLIDFGYTATKYLIYGGRVTLMLLTFYFLKNRKESDIQLKLFWEWSYLFLVIPLFFPQQRLYNFLFLLPALSYIIAYQIKKYTVKKKVTWGLFLLFFLMLLFNLEILIGIFRKYLWYHKYMTYATFLLLGLLLYCKPGKFEKVTE